jgi:SAM-dependent methyltransferase
MSDIIIRRDTCRLCSSRALDLALHLNPTPLADAYVPREQVEEVQPSYPLDLFLCRDCGYVQLLDVVQAEAVYRDYLYETTSSLGLVEHFSNYAGEVLSRTNLGEGSLVVDIGSNDGTLLRAFKDRGMRVLGVDPAREIARKATASGIQTLPEFFDARLAREIIGSHGPASLITCNNLFANVDDVTSLTESLRDLLTPDGIFVFESFYLADFICNMVFDFAYHEHLSYFSVRPLQKFFDRCKMELFDVERIGTKGGSLRYFVQRKGAARPLSPIVGELAQAEKELGLDQPEAFAKFDREITSAKNALLQYLNQLKAEKKTIAGYGASATTTTLIYHFELCGLLDFIADDFAAKQNLFSPGCHIPVLPSTALYERKPDFVLVIAWRYVEPIARKHERYLAEGGHFIVPLPQLRVI